jgi:peptidoglycan hydrolase-like protein with peptidoglycan-binding domain
LLTRRLGWAAAIAVVLAAATALALWRSRADGADRTTGEPIPVATATIVRTDMSTVEALPGRLGYGPAVTIKGRGSGTVTWLPKPGTAVRRGEQLYRVDDQPVPLFHGALPLYRTLDRPNMVGRDVRVVAENLRALGYSTGHQPGTGERVAQVRPRTSPAPEGAAGETPEGAAGKTPEGAAGKTPEADMPAPDTTWVKVGKGEDVLTAALIRAVKRWQADVGGPVTGSVDPADVVVLPGTVRVDSVTATVGDEVAAPLLAVTPTAKVVTVSVEAGEAGEVGRGDKVSVVLPDEKTATGRVTGVGTEVTSPDEESSEPGGPPTLAVTVTLDNPTAVARIDAAEVQVQFPADSVEGVLAVPIGALVALSEGGYAVQLAGGGLVAVQVGMFAKGLVQVTGDGLAEGTSVVTAS